MADWPPDFGALTRASEGRLVEALGLHPLALPPELARMDGEWQGGPIVSEARAYRGAGVALARFATVLGRGLSIGNLLVLPAPTSSAPIFGADLVWIGTRPQAAMIACDLSPTLDEFGAREAQNAAVASVLPPAVTVPPGGPLPAWCDAIFSSSPLYTRFGVEDAEVVQGVFGAYVEAFVMLASGSSAKKPTPLPKAAPGAVSRGIHEYVLRHREDDRGLLLLERLFGKTRAERYLNEVLFPTSIDGCAT